MRAATIRKDFDIPELLKGIYREMEISPIGLLKNYALNLICSKIHKYEAEDMHLNKKYNCSFEEFNRKIGHMKDKENFEWEDDLLDWEFAIENLEYWKRKAKEIQSK